MNYAVIISFLSVTALVALISVYKSRNLRIRSSADYFLGNRSLGFWMIGSSLFLTNMSANQFIGENEFVYTTNMSVMCWAARSGPNFSGLFQGQSGSLQMVSSTVIEFRGSRAVSLHVAHSSQN